MYSSLAPVLMCLQQNHIIIDNLPRRGFWDDSSVVLTLALVVIGGFTFIAVRHQAIETAKAAKAAAESVKEMHKQVVILERQTTATEEAAKAALLNAQAVINTERPWLVVTWGSDRKEGTFFRFGCHNKGNTPATVEAIWATWSIVSHPDGLPVPPDYKALEVLPDLALVVSDRDFDIGNGINVQEILEREPHKRSLVYQGGLFLIYFGKVVYRDALYESDHQNCHETRFCFVYVPPDVQRGIAASLIRGGDLTGPRF